MAIMSDTDARLIETMRVEPGRRVPLQAGHWRRLQSSCTALGYAWPADALLRGVQEHIGSLDANECHRLRLLLSRNGEFVLESNPLPALSPPVHLRLSATPLQADAVWLRHKTTHRPWYEAAQAWLAHHPEFFDVVFCNELGEVCEGSRSNIYLLDARTNTWLTPPLDCGLLPGVQRQELLDRGRVQEARVTREQFLNAPAIRVSNALRGWLDAAL